MDTEYSDEVTLKSYQEFTLSTWKFADTAFIDVSHAFAGLGAEAGEVLAAEQKYLRGDYCYSVKKERLAKELGGLLYYMGMLCNLHGLSLEEIARTNKLVLEDRLSRGVIQGDGDDR